MLLTTCLDWRMKLRELCITSCVVGIIGQPFANMLMNFPNHVIGANEMEEFQISNEFAKSCDRCQRDGGISKR